MENHELMINCPECISLKIIDALLVLEKEQMIPKHAVLAFKLAFCLLFLQYKLELVYPLFLSCIANLLDWTIKIQFLTLNHYDLIPTPFLYFPAMFKKHFDLETLIFITISSNLICLGNFSILIAKKLNTFCCLIVHLTNLGF